MPSCLGCIYGQSLHVCLPKTHRYRPRSEFDNWQDWVEQNIDVENEPIDQYIDKREEIRKRLADMRKSG